MLDGLNPEQKDAVSTLAGPLLVLAGAGTGKTRVVTFRIARLIKKGIRPDRILAVTFTNKAAAEMQERVGELLPRGVEERPVVSTFHSHCVRILRRHATKLGYPETWGICDRGDQEGIARDVLREIRVPSETMRPGDLLYAISRWKNRSCEPMQAVTESQTDKEHVAAAGYRRYQSTLKNRGIMDFDDLLLNTENLFSKFEETRREEAARFDHLLIDEYQDTNGSQYGIVKSLAQDHRNLCVVGDDDQSIYGWRGAEVAHILNFTKHWPEAKTVRLVRNYRSTEAIIERANTLITFNKERYPKQLIAARQGGQKPRIEQFKNTEDEAAAVVANIQRVIAQPDWEPRDIAILFRTNEQPRAFETELRKAKLPYVLIGGKSFFDRKEVRDVLAYIKTIAAPRDEMSLLRIVNKPPRGISQNTVEKLRQRAVASGEPVWTIMTRLAQTPDLPANAQRAVEGFVSLIHYFQQLQKTKSLTSVVRELLAKIRYQSDLARQYPDPNEQQTRWAAVEEVINALAAYEQKAKKPSLREFVDEILLEGRDFGDSKEKQMKGNAIVLMTLHSAKGLEFPHVYMVGMEEGILPHHRSVAEEGKAIDEERRLCYVGVTRAQEYLTLSMALTRMKWGKPRESQPSRFLFELIGQADNVHGMQKPKGRAAHERHTQQRTAAMKRGAAARAARRRRRGK